MPTAGLASTFSDHYDGEAENAVVFTLGTTLLSVILGSMFIVVRLYYKGVKNYGIRIY